MFQQYLSHHSHRELSSFVPHPLDQCRAPYQHKQPTCYFPFVWKRVFLSYGNHTVFQYVCPCWPLLHLSSSRTGPLR